VSQTPSLPPVVSRQVADYLRHAAVLRAEIDADLDRRTQRASDCPSRLSEAIRYSLLAPGKRLRPQLALMACEACGYDREGALPVGAAVEMIHAYSLIHDDLPAMDDDDLRRGRPTCHKQFDEATAILAGDALQAMAFESISTLGDPLVAAACCRALACAAGPCGLVGGQADDLDGEFVGGDIEHLQHIHRRKTGALINVSLQMGALVAHASVEKTTALDQYGKRLGLAFQIVDDLLDVQGNTADVGKRTGKDAERGKQTFPALLGIPESQRRATQLVHEACVAIEILGASAEPLVGLAQYVLERNH
jgi:geranylgeranyl diphosphate synthase type II